MKIQCDVCDKEEASVFCCADEAVLCSGCDHRVHHANKLAGKHLRFSLLHPSSLKEASRCDICQERRAFLFCKEDRAILCRECDIPIHEHTRFLLTGVKLSASAISTSKSNKGFQSAITSVITSPSQTSESGSVSTSSISEYLGTLPGWCLDDFLDPSSTASNHLY